MPVTSEEPSRLLAGLTPSQCRAVTAPSATVCVLAAAGAGKTRVLTRRVAYRVATGTARAEHVLAITFTRKAAGELRERLVDLGLVQAVTAGTFHSVALGQLRRWWADRRTPEPALLQRKGRLLSELSSGRPGLSEVTIGDLASHVEWAKARLVSPASFAAEATKARRELPTEPEAIAAVYARYEDEKRRRRLIDFDDLLVRYADALDTDSRFAAAQRWRWHHLFVDELQDVNPLQCRLLLSLLGSNEDLFVVGDPNQAIYGWNGADPDFLANFPRRWPQAEVVRLDDNHRSSPQVVAAASAALGRQASGPVRSSRPEGPLPRLLSYPSEEAEAAAVASQIRAAQTRGLRWDKMAVLARTNTQLDSLAQALRNARVPFRAVLPSEEAEPEGDQSPRGGDTSGEHVTVCSFHRAKGLQWTAVWVCGLEAGFVPIAYACTAESWAEERRLLYVALTRAERELYCSWARTRRMANGLLLQREPSPWLASLAGHCAGVGPGTGTGVGDGTSLAGLDRPGTAEGAGMTHFLASARDRLSHSKVGVHRRGTPPDAVGAAVAERLREWRRRLARASGVPPHVLLHDATLGVIAARRPSTTEELLAVPGLGPIKVARYGPAILDVVRQTELVPAAGAIGARSSAGA